MKESARKLQAQAVVTLASIPYLVDLAWQVPLGSRVSWLTTSTPNPESPRPPAQVFLVRGSGTIFSSGFGELCDRLRREGIWCEDLGPVGQGWICKHLLAQKDAGQLPGTIILVGHSRGGRRVLDAAAELQKAGIAVDLLVCLDVAMAPLVPDNVRQALHVYMGQQIIYPSTSLKASEASTILENIDLSQPGSAIKYSSLSHLNITSNPAVRDFVLERILRVVRAGQPETR